MVAPVRRRTPPVPDPNYIWTPGYWAYGEDGYYSVPGTWMLAPQPNLLWTPGYWAWSGGVFVWKAGYWATQGQLQRRKLWRYGAPE